IPIAFAHFGGTAISAFGGLGTTSATLSGAGAPYFVTFTGSYPAGITASKLVVQATAESGNSMLANSACSSASTTGISCAVWIWPVTSAPATTTNGGFITVWLGR